MKITGNDGEFISRLVRFQGLAYINRRIHAALSSKDQIRYAIFAAEQIVGFEKKFPDDFSLRRVIFAAKKCLKNPTEENALSAYVAAAGCAVADAIYSAEIYGILDRILSCGSKLLEEQNKREKCQQ